jgi:predicted N-acetyltransferase YhbS
MRPYYTQAEVSDYDELIDFGNYVFSHAHGPTDFPGLLPKLYRREYFMEGTHYLAKEHGRIRAAVGAYPLTLRILDTVLPARGIGMVSVHPYARSRGYMRTLMDMALADMRRDGIALSCLGGQRQRYEYFGFSPAGTQILYQCRPANIRHILGPNRPPAFSVRQLQEGDPELGAIHEFHQSKPARFERDREKLFAILSSWKNRTFVLHDGKDFAGYLVYNDAEHSVPELNLSEPARAAEALGCFLDYLGMKNDRDRLDLCAQPWETAKLEALAAFAEDYRVSPAYSFAVLNWQPLLSALLNLKAATRALPDGSALFRVTRGMDHPGEETRFRVTVHQGKPQVRAGAGDGAIVLDQVQAIRFFFAPLSPWTSPALHNNPFLQSLLPLPLFFETPDGV